MKKHKITAGLVVLLSAIALTGCGGNKKTPEDAEKTEQKMPVSKKLSQAEIQTMVKKAAKISADSAKVKLDVTTKVGKRIATQKSITKYSADSKTMYRKLASNGQENTLWGKGNRIYVQVRGKWYTAKSKNALEGTKSNQKTLRDAILSFNGKSILPHVVSERQTGTNLVKLTYDLSSYQKKTLIRNKATMLVNEHTGEVQDLIIKRSSPTVKLYGHFYQINANNDLKVPTYIKKVAKPAQAQ